MCPCLRFFGGHRRVQKGNVKVIKHVDMQLVREKWECRVPFKQTRRLEDNISIITARMQVKLAVIKAEGGEEY